MFNTVCNCVFYIWWRLPIPPQLMGQNLNAHRIGLAHVGKTLRNRLDFLVPEKNQTLSLSTVGETEEKWMQTRLWAPEGQHICHCLHLVLSRPQNCDTWLLCNMNKLIIVIHVYVQKEKHIWKILDALKLGLQNVFKWIIWIFLSLGLWYGLK